MGGVPPLGYDVRDGRLVVNRPEAADSETHLRAISRTRFRPAPEKRFKTPLRLSPKSGCRKTACDLEAVEFLRGALYELLSGEIYLGEICHKKEPPSRNSFQPMVSLPRAVGEVPTALARSGRHASRTPNQGPTQPAIG